MNKPKILLLLPLLLSCNAENESSDFDKFTGRWTLSIVETQKDTTSRWEPRQGNYKNRKGFIIYDGKGGMGVHHVTENYEAYEFEGSGGLDSLTTRDLRHLADNFVYFGKYTVNDTLNIIEHHIESANFQAMWGTVAIRRYEFSGDTLTLYPLTNRYPKSRLRWIRLNDH
ncbi:lipocalin-like domain-containing protein [Robiginitalea sp. SC105]|uniref:lipocalin-like domain-containing protein n=1 Tax=Robiginitalea sp. SC105 TaxID=2762332 RepID=UPI00163AFC14|nr:lipocalin-like domain-containing protein [Robiginitalea sp. SC105]MBC2838154.1 lipocalin-like domain-containing protein [Robiginitalea sp. SC105]